MALSTMRSSFFLAALLAAFPMWAGFDIAGLLDSAGKPDKKKAEAFSKELKEIVGKVLASQPSFNELKARDEAKTELGLLFIPGAPKDDSELVKSVEKTAQLAADEEFTEQLRKKVEAEARLKYQIYKVGEKITVPLRKGRGFDNYLGVYKGWKDGRILIGERTVLREDVPEDKMHFFDKKFNSELRNEYISRNFIELKEDAKKEACIKLFAESKKENEIARKFKEHMDEKAKKHSLVCNAAAATLAIDEFLRVKSEEFDKERSVFRKLDGYMSLVANIQEGAEKMGVDLDPSRKAGVGAILKESELFSTVKDKTIPALKEERNRKLTRMSLLIGVPALLVLLVVALLVRRRSAG